MTKLVKALRTIAYGGLVVNQGETVYMDEENIEAFGSEHVQEMEEDIPKASEEVTDENKPDEESDESKNDEPF